MCMWVVDGARVNFDRVMAFRLSFLAARLHCGIRSLCILINSSYSFLLGVSSTLQTYCGPIEDKQGF